MRKSLSAHLPINLARPTFVFMYTTMFDHRINDEQERNRKSNEVVKA